MGFFYFGHAEGVPLLWETEFETTVTPRHPISPALQAFCQHRGVVLPMPNNEVHIGIAADPSGSMIWRALALSEQC